MKISVAPDAVIDASTDGGLLDLKNMRLGRYIAYLDVTIPPNFHLGLCL